MAMKPESNANNIHVFRVSRAAFKRDDAMNNTLTSPPPNKSRTSISAETKRLICEDHMENPKFTQEAIAQKYGCKRTTIAKIIKSKDRWLSIESDTASSKRFRQRSSRYPSVENAVMSWLKDEYNSDISSVTDHMLRQQARKYAQEYHREGADDFKASSSWLLNFKRRYINEMDGSGALDHRSTPSSSPAATTAFTDTPMQDVEPITIQFDTPITPTTPPTSSNNNNSHHQHRAKNQAPKIHSLIESSARLVHASSSFISSQRAIDGEERLSSTTTEDEDASMEDDIKSEDEEGGEVDYCDGMESPNFDNIDDIALSPENTTATTSTTTKEATAPVNEASSISSIHPKQQPLARRITKSQAKKHLEAALEFFTSQRSSKPMSADMIKLILQNDF